MLADIAVQNKYYRWYCQIIEKARLRNEEVKWPEKHHAQPRALGGGDEEENIVVLSYREHFLAHWLLPKFLEGNLKRKMTHALQLMGIRKDSHIRTAWQRKIAMEANRAPLNEEHRKRIGEGNKGKVRSEEFRKLISEAVRRRPPASEETREKMRVTMTGRKFGPRTPEQIERMRQAQLGRECSEETKQKMREAHLGKKFSDKHRANLSAFQKSRDQTVNIQRLKEMNKARRGIPMDPKITEKMRVTRNTDEARRANSERVTNLWNDGAYRAKQMAERAGRRGKSYKNRKEILSSSSFQQMSV